MTLGDGRTATVGQWPPAASRMPTRAHPPRPPIAAHERPDADEPQRRLARPAPEPRARRVPPPPEGARLAVSPLPEQGAVVDRLRPARPRARGGFDVAAPRARQVLLDRLLEPRRVLRRPDRGAHRQ